MKGPGIVNKAKRGIRSAGSLCVKGCPGFKNKKKGLLFFHSNGAAMPAHGQEWCCFCEQSDLFFYYFVFVWFFFFLILDSPFEIAPSFDLR